MSFREIYSHVIFANDKTRLCHISILGVHNPYLQYGKNVYFSDDREYLKYRDSDIKISLLRRHESCLRDPLGRKCIIKCKKKQTLFIARITKGIHNRHKASRTA